MAIWFKRIAVVLAFACIAENYAHAQFPHITMLSDRKFYPIEQSDVIYKGNWKQYNSKIGDVSVATLTMEFISAEIGQDYEAANALAMKEAAKIGADLLFFVSGTEYKNTRAIASMTYRCVRSGIFSQKNERETDGNPYFFKTIRAKSVIEVHLREAPDFDSPSVYIVRENSTIYFVLRWLMTFIAKFTSMDVEGSLSQKTFCRRSRRRILGNMTTPIPLNFKGSQCMK